MVVWFRVSQCGGQIYSFINNFVWNLPPIGEKLLVVAFISSLNGNMESVLVILINDDRLNAQKILDRLIYENETYK